MDFLLDANNDLVLRNGDLVIATPIEEAIQRNKQRLSFLFGEFFLADDRGIPYFEYIFTKLITIEEVNDYFKAVIQSIDGNLEILKFKTEFEPKTRALIISYSVLTKDGPISISVSSPSILNLRV